MGDKAPTISTPTRSVLPQARRQSKFLRAVLIFWNARGEYAGVAMYDLNDNGTKAMFAICNEEWSSERAIRGDAARQAH